MSFINFSHRTRYKSIYFFFLVMRRPPISTLFPYTTHFRSHRPVGKIPVKAGLQPLVKHSADRSEEHTSELQSQSNLVCRLLLEKKKTISTHNTTTKHTTSTTLNKNSKVPPTNHPSQNRLQT